MKKILLFLGLFLLIGTASAQQFSLPILPEKMWPSDYAKYETDVLYCCNYLLSTDPSYNQPKHEECTTFLMRWLTGTPEVKVIVHPDLVDIKSVDLMLAYMAAWTRHALQNKGDNPLLCANVATEEMLRFYETYRKSMGKSKMCDKLLKEQEKGNLPAIVAKALVQ